MEVMKTPRDTKPNINIGILGYWDIGRAELAFSPSSEKWPGNTFLDVKSRLESIARIGLLKKNDLEVACGR